MYRFILKADCDASLYIGNERIKLSKSEPKVLEFETASSFDFDILPWPTCALQFHVFAKFDGENYLVENQNIKIIKIDGNTHIFKICAKNTNNLQKKCKKITKNGIFFNFYQNGVVEIEDENSLLFCEKFDVKIFDADVLELKNGCYCLKLYGENGVEKSVIIDNNFVSVLSFDSTVVETTERGFKVLTDLKDIACHGFVETFEIDDSIKKIDEYSVYLKGSPQKNFNENVLPVYFLQCIRANDFLEAKHCLSQELSGKAKNEHLKAYFGNFLDITTFENKIYLVYQSNFMNAGSNNYFAKETIFKVANGKIVDIA